MTTLNVRSGRFEDDLLAIVGGADRRDPGLWRSTVGSLGVGWAIALTGFGVGLLTTPDNRAASATITVPASGPRVGSAATGVAPSVGIAHTSAPGDEAGTIAPRPERLLAPPVLAPLRHGPAARHFAASAGKRSGSTVMGARRLPLSNRDQMATGLTPTTVDTGGRANQFAAEQERSDTNVPTSRQSTIAARDALRDLRLR